jgi:hypothetical protein
VLVVTVAFTYVLGSGSILSWATSLASAVCAAFLLQRFGILAVFIGISVIQFIMNNPLSVNVHACYGSAVWSVGAIVVGLMAWALTIIRPAAIRSPHFLRPTTIS